MQAYNGRTFMQAYTSRTLAYASQQRQNITLYQLTLAEH
jgi:hypothetical protein